MKIILDDLGCIDFGSNYVGSGGGEVSIYPKMVLKYQLKKRPINVVSLKSLASDDMVVTIGAIGCTSIEVEKMYSFSNFEKLFQKIENTYQKKITAICSIGIGGGHLFIPLFLSSYFDIPLIDGDLFGRCFPELQILSTNVAGIYPKKTFASNAKSDIFEINSENLYDLENYMRHITMSSGGCCMVVPQVLTGEEAKRGIIPGTLTQVLTIGKIIKENRNFDELMAYTQGKMIGVGGIMAVDYLTNTKYFNMKITIRNYNERKTWEILMDNEYSLLFENGVCVAEVPDIITICHAETYEPLNLSMLHYGMNVIPCTMKAPDIWYTEKGLLLSRSQKYLEGKEALCALV